MGWWWPTSTRHLADSEDRILECVDVQTERKGIEISEGRVINTLLCGHHEEDAHRKPALVLCHGYGAGLGFYAKNYDYLSQHYRVYAFDWLGFGRSSRPRYKGRSTEDAESWFTAAFDEWTHAVGLSDEKFILCGHSLGGYLSAVFALENPERLHALLLVSPVGVPELPPERKSKLPLRYRMITKVGKVFNLAPGSIVRAAGPYGPSLTRKFRSHMAKRFADVYDDESVVLDYTYHMTVAKGSGEFATNHILNEMAYANRPLINRLHALKMPTAFMYGDQDWMDCSAGQQAAETLAVDNEVVIIPRAGHNIFVDNPHGFHAALQSALAKFLGRTEHFERPPEDWEFILADA